MVGFTTPAYFAYNLQVLPLLTLLPQTQSCTASLAGVMGNVAGVMKKVNESVSTEETAKIMQQFAVENEKMNMSEEMMDDALIDAVRAERGAEFWHICQTTDLSVLAKPQFIQLTHSCPLPSPSRATFKERKHIVRMCRLHTRFVHIEIPTLLLDVMCG